MRIATEPIGSIPRPSALIDEITKLGDDCDPKLASLSEEASRDTLQRFEATMGVSSTIDPHIETPDEVRDRVLEAAEYIPLEQLGTTDDCGFSPFCDDTSTTRDTAFAKIRSRVVGTALAAEILSKG